jgi:ferredoxin-NADP reductase
VTESQLSNGVVATRWQRGIVRDVRKLSALLVALRIEIPDRIGHLPGQHFVVRLTAEDGYTASRSYSIASAPQDDLVELCVERLEDGEVSNYLYDVVEVGDEIEVRGPIGGWFVWNGQTPALGVGGGSGVVPLVSMARHALAIGSPELFGVVASAREVDRLPYADELISFGATIALTAPPTGRRLGPAEIAAGLRSAEIAFICGSAQFAESMSRVVVDEGFPESRVRVERFGPTG